ncbi:MAG: hypothetical protein WC635_03565 [Bacteriovorax sp.]|jgi:hypothetical protein
MMNRMIKITITILSIATTVCASEQAPWKKHQEEMKCKNEFQSLVVSAGIEKEHFRKDIGESYNETVYRSIPETIGNWAEVHLTEKKAPFIYKIVDEKIMKYSLNESCIANVENTQWPHYLEKILSNTMSEDWSNKDLKNLVNTGKKGIIYTWSPKYTYSLLALPQVQRLAKEMGLDFVAVVDPRSSKKEILASLKVLPKVESFKFRNLASDKKFYRNISIDLFMRASFNHYPVVFAYSNKKIHPRFVTGLMTDQGFKDLVQTYAKELE